MAEEKTVDPRDFKVHDPAQLPTDSVQVIRFCQQDSTIFACGCWDEHVRIYQITSNGMQKGLVQKFALHVGGPVLDISWSATSPVAAVATGAETNNLVLINLAASPPTPQPIGTHHHVCNLLFGTALGTEVLFTVGMNKVLSAWINQGGSWGKKLDVSLPKYPSCMDYDGSSGLLVVGMEQDLGILRMDKVASGSTGIQTLTITLKSPISCLKIRERAKEEDHKTWNENERTIVVCGTDGRTLVGELNLTSTPLRIGERILYRAHIKQADLFPINSCGFSRISSYSMYTVGADGNVFFWDLINKNKLTCYATPESTPFTCGELSHTQQYFAFATGYDWSQGVWGAGKFLLRPQVFVHEMTEADHKKKPGK